MDKKYLQNDKSDKNTDFNMNLQRTGKTESVNTDSGDLDDFIFKDITPKYVSER